MKQEHYHKSIIVNGTPAEAFERICEVNGWWAKNLEGNTEQLNDVFTVRFGTTFVTFSITEAVPGKRIVWLVTDCYLPWLKNDKTEWNGTRVIFSIDPVAEGTRIDFTHEGLTPQAECYENCRVGWDCHLEKGLQSLVNIGVGEPQ